MPDPTIITPGGLYPGAGKAKLLHVNQQGYVWQNERILATQASQALQLERVKSSFYPWGTAIQLEFSGAPGVFQVDIEASEDDRDASYVSIVSIAAVNSQNVGRAAIGFTWPKYVRGKVITLTNNVNTTLLFTR